MSDDGTKIALLDRQEFDKSTTTIEEIPQNDLLADVRDTANKQYAIASEKLVYSEPPVNPIFIIDNRSILLKHSECLKDVRQYIKILANHYLGAPKEWINDAQIAVCEILTNSDKYSQANYVNLKTALWHGTNNFRKMYYIIEDNGANLSLDELKHYVNPFVSSLPCCSKVDHAECSMGLGISIALKLSDAFYACCSPEGALTITIEKSIFSTQPVRRYDQRP